MRKFTGALFSLFLFAASLYGLIVLYERHQEGQIQDAGLEKKYEVLRHGDGSGFPGVYQFSFDPGSLVRASLLKDKKKIYEVSYEFNEHGVRHVPLTAPEKASRHLIFSACSYMFGEGIPIQKTTAALVERALLDTNTYSISFMGGHLGTLVRYLEVRPLDRMVKEKKGSLVYVFMLDHLPRWFVRPSYMTWASADSPHYELKGGELVYMGELSKQPVYEDFLKRYRGQFKHTVLRSEAFLKEDFEWTDEELMSFARALKAAEKLYQKTFPQGKLIFIFHPLILGPYELKDRVGQFVRAEGIPVFDPVPDYEAHAAALKLDHNDFSIPHDGHPNERMNKFFAEWLLKGPFRTP